MTNETRHADDIERDIRDERLKMSDTINDLQKKFSVDAVVGDIGAMFRNQGGDLGRAISDTVGRNPAAVALVGVGLAWLFIGQNRNRSAGVADAPRDVAPRTTGRQTAAEFRHNRAAQSGLPHDEHSAEPDAYWYGPDNLTADDGDHRHGAHHTSDGTAATIQTTTGAVGAAMRNTTDAVGGAISGAADSLGQAASGLTDRMSHGLDGLPDAARSRVLAARRAADDARRASRDAMKTGTRAASNFFAEQPLVVGALAVAVGAALGGALPHSRLEDDTLGTSSDRLFADAQALFRDERAKAMAALRLAASDVQCELQDIGSELAGLLPEGKNVGDVIVGRASDAAMRVADHATGDILHRESDRSAG